MNEQNIKKGDWKCPECNTNNFSKRDKCFKCRSFKSDWICPQCIFINKSFKKENDNYITSTTVCEQCQFEKDLSKEKFTLTYDELCKKDPTKTVDENFLDTLSKFLINEGFDWNAKYAYMFSKDQRSMFSDVLRRKRVFKSYIKSMIQNIINELDPDTGHRIQCTCDSCCGISKPY